MKHVFMTAANLTCSLPVEPKEPPVACVEFALSSFDYVYELDISGQPIKRRSYFSDRFVTEPKQLRELAKSFNQWADECEQAAKAHMVNYEEKK